jgi:predicted ATPase
MKTLVCGDIVNDTVMEWCLLNCKYSQHDQFLCGYNWECNTNHVRTNSDLFLQGVRLAVKDGKFKPEDVEIIFYPSDKNDPNYKYVIRIFIDKNGNLDHWPKGFFDEMTKTNLRFLG